MPLYYEGSVSLPAGSRVATGTGTTFGEHVRPGDVLVADARFYQVSSVESDTALTVHMPAAQAFSGAGYVILQSIHTDNNRYLLQKIEGFLQDRQRSLVEFVDWINGEVNGGPGADGRFALTDRFGQTRLAKSPLQIEADGNALVEALRLALGQAESRLDEIGHLDAYVSGAAGSATAAAASASASARDAALAAASRGQASTSAHEAAASAATAATKASDAAAGATRAESSAGQAASSASAANAARAQAATSESRASASATSATDSAATADAAAAAATGSAHTASAQAVDAQASAATAAGRASAAGASATAAAASATAAAGDATSARASSQTASQARGEAITASDDAGKAADAAEAANASAQTALAAVLSHGNGWTPALAAQPDGERVVIRVLGWSGGRGTAPGTGFVGANGVVAAAAQALNVRGAAGQGTGRVDSVNGLSANAAGNVTLGMGDIAGLTQAIAQAARTGSVQTVAGAAPDGAGNVALTAHDVDADPAGTAAAEVEMLGDSLSAVAYTGHVTDVLGIGSAASRHVPSTGNAASDQVVLGNDARLTNARTPTAHTHDAGAIVSGRFALARLPTQYADTAASTTNWDSALTTGTWMGSEADNAPGGGWWIGHVVAHNANYVTQTLWSFTHPAQATDSRAWRRACTSIGGVRTWQAWHRVRMTESELDARYVQASSVAVSQAANTIVQRDSAGLASVVTVNLSDGQSARPADTVFYSSTDSILRKNTAAGMKTSLGLHPVASSGAYDDLVGTPAFAPVATSGRYTDLTDRPVIPTLPSAMSQAEANAGTAATGRVVTASVLKAAILAHASAASGVDAATVGGASAASLRDRASHSGTQPIASVAGLQSALDQKLTASAAATVATSGSYNDLSNRPSIPAALSAMTQAEANTGTASAARSLSAAVLRQAVNTHTAAVRTTADTALTYATRPRMAVFVAGTSSFTVPAGVTTLILSGIGGGGGGGGGGGHSAGGSTTGAGGGGGASGAWCFRTPVAVTPGTTYSVVVGNGGSPGGDRTTAGAVGGSGGETRLGHASGALVRLPGGRGGAGGGHAPGRAFGGAGGTGLTTGLSSNGIQGFAGQAGTMGQSGIGGTGNGGQGAGAPWFGQGGGGGSGQAGVGVNGAPGQGALGYGVGGGGGGACTEPSGGYGFGGGSGGAGILIIEW